MTKTKKRSTKTPAEDLFDLFASVDLTTVEVAKRAGISYSTLWNLKHGVVRSYRARIVGAIAAACGVPADRVIAAVRRTAAKQEKAARS